MATPTPKQQRVLAELESGKTITEIAQKMRITPAGVSHHVRKLREMGITLPNEAPPAPPAAPPEPETRPVATNGHVDEPEAALRAAIERSNERVSEIAREMEALDEKRQQLSEERERLASQSEKYTAALDALS